MGVSISGFVTTALAFVRARWGVLLLASLISVLPGQVYSWLTYLDLLPNLHVWFPNALLPPPDFGGYDTVSLIIYWLQMSAFIQVFNLLLYGVFISTAVAMVSVTAAAWKKDEFLTPKALIEKVLPGILPVWLYLLCAFVLFGFAFILFVIPYIYLSVVCFVAAFAAADKRLWPLGAIRKSFEVTRGARWFILCFVVASLLLSALQSAVRTAVLQMVMSSGFDRETVLIGYKVINSIWAFLKHYVEMVIVASVYVVLLRSHEGPSSVEVAEAFD
jgi:hypothetical protein